MEELTLEDQIIGLNPKLERADNSPVVVSKYGFREEVIDGKTYLLAMSKEEYIETIKSSTDIPKERLEKLINRIENNKATCYMYTTYSCATRDNCQTCNIGNVGSRYYCYCSD